MGFPWVFPRHYLTGPTKASCSYVMYKVWVEEGPKVLVERYSGESAVSRFTCFWEHRSRNCENQVIILRARGSCIDHPKTLVFHVTWGHNWGKHSLRKRTSVMPERLRSLPESWTNLDGSDAAIDPTLGIYIFFLASALYFCLGCFCCMLLSNQTDGNGRNRKRCQCAERRGGVTEGGMSTHLERNNFLIRKRFLRSTFLANSGNLRLTLFCAKCARTLMYIGKNRGWNRMGWDGKVVKNPDGCFQKSLRAGVCILALHVVWKRGSEKEQ